MRTKCLVTVLVSLIVATASSIADPRTNDHKNADSDPTRLDAMDQSSDRSQTELIANIRAALTDRDDLSTAAKNLTIVSTGERGVQISGQVPSAVDKSRVMEIANRFAAVVDDRIVVR